MPIDNGFFTLLYADDTTLEFRHNDLDHLVTYTNLKLTLASDWFLANRLTLNAKKTKCILFSPNSFSPPLPKHLVIDNTKIERIGMRFKVKSFKLVGVHLEIKMG